MRTSLLDRDGELADLERQLRLVRAGAGRVIVVEGPAGIGKSSLLATAAAVAQARGMTVVQARGGPLEVDAGWGIVRQLFEPLRSDSDWAELRAGAAALAERALDPATPEPAQGGDALHAALHGLTWLASNLSERAPTLLVVDDVHWADAASLRWLAQFARRLEDLPLAVLCAVRTGEPCAAADLLAELLATAADPPVRPSALGLAASETIVLERLPSAAGAFANACHAVTAGNPFLLGALLRHLVSEQVVPDARTAQRLSAFGPEQVTRTVDRQLARLPEGARAVARALAVLGRDASLRQAGRLARLEPREAVRAVDALRDAGLVEGTERIALTHPLVASALHQGLAAGERSLWHADAAHVLRHEDAEPEQVALHLLHTDPQGDPVAVGVLQDAAAGAILRGALDSACRFLRRALAEPPATPADAAAIRMELGLARAAHVQPDAADLLREAANAAATSRQRAEIALRSARALAMAGHTAHALELSRRGLEDVSDVPDDDRERLEAELVCCASLDAATAAEFRARMRAPEGRRGRLGLWRANAMLLANADSRPRAELLELMEPMLEAGTLEREVESVVPSAAQIVLIAYDELEVVIAGCSGLLEYARPRGWRIALVHGSFLRSMALVRAGRIRDAQVDAHFAVDFKRLNSPVLGLLWSVIALVDALVEADALDAADAALEETDLAGDLPAGALPAPLLLQSRARLRLAQHRPAEALADAEAAAGRWREHASVDAAFATWRNEAVHALAALGEDGRARRLAEEQVEVAARLAVPSARAAALRALACTTPAEEAIDRLEAAVAAVGESAAVLEHTRALVDLGAALRRANRRADARAPLRLAADLAERGGMGRLAARADSELRAAGARPRRSALTGPGALTPSEHRVATLAAEGLGNREIAQQLYVTRRTVETHLTHVFQKLDVAGREDLPASLERPPELAGVSAADA